MFFSLGEPPRTQYDWNFHVLGIPVRVHPIFWLLAILWGANLREGGAILMWVGVVFVSILVHELGHALMMRRYGMSPAIVLYAMGGLAIPRGHSSHGPFGNARNDLRSELAILFAGPGAGFLLAGIVIALVYASGGTMHWFASFPQFWRHQWGGGWENNARINLLTELLLFVNIFWGLMNLLPVYPLDGGRICRELMVWKDPYQGVIRSLWVSLIAAAAAAFWGLTERRLVFVLLFGSLAYSSYQAIQQMGGGYGRRW